MQRKWPCLPNKGVQWQHWRRCRRWRGTTQLLTAWTAGWKEPMVFLHVFVSYCLDQWICGMGRNYPPKWMRFTAEVPKFWRRLLQVPEPLGSLDALASSGSAPLSCWREMPSGASSEAWCFLCLGVKLCQVVMTKVSQMSCFSWDWDQCAAFSSTFSHVSSSTLVLHVGKSHEFMPICIIPQKIVFCSRLSSGSSTHTQLYLMSFHQNSSHKIWSQDVSGCPLNWNFIQLKNIDLHTQAVFVEQKMCHSLLIHDAFGMLGGPRTQFQGHQWQRHLATWGACRSALRVATAENIDLCIAHTFQRQSYNPVHTLL